ncbi:MAG: Loki-CTERM sorting domain-containing protein [Candidatus Hermodarchaeia archaeon]|jgi:hypothetical protein
MRKWSIPLITLLVLLITIQLNGYPILNQSGNIPQHPITVSAQHEAVWNKTYGGTGTDWGSSVIELSGGGFAVVGFTVNYGAGDNDAWLVRTDANGNHLWNQSYGGINSDTGTSVVEVAGGGFAICGETQSYGAGSKDMWLVRTDANGNHLWNQTFGGINSDQAHTLVVLSDGGFALAGITTSFGAGSNDAWLVRTDSSGTHMWNQTFGGTNGDLVSSLIEVSGGFAFVGTTSSFGAGGEDIWLVRTDTSGNHLWNQTFGGSEDDEGYSVKALSGGGYVLAGATASYGHPEGDMYLARANNTGHYLWHQTFGTSTFDWGWSVVEVSTGGFAIVGASYGLGAGLFDVWLVRTDSSGSFLWDKTYGGASSDWGFSIIEVSSGGFALACTTETFGEGAEDMWLLRIPGEGTTPTTTDFPIPGFPIEAILIAMLAVLSIGLVKRRRGNPS